MHGLLIYADALVLRQQGFLCPGPKVCAGDEHVRPGARVDVEMNIRAIAVGVVFGAFQFDLSGKKSILLQTGLYKVRRLLKRGAVVGFAVANRRSAKSRKQRGKTVLQIGGFSWRKA